MISGVLPSLAAIQGVRGGSAVHDLLPGERVASHRDPRPSNRRATGHVVQSSGLFDLLRPHRRVFDAAPGLRRGNWIRIEKETGL